jgi:hypothetical protein
VKSEKRQVKNLVKSSIMGRHPGILEQTKTLLNLNTVEQVIALRACRIAPVTASRITVDPLTVDR